MKRLKVLLTAALLLIGCGTAAYADPPGRVARLNHIAGPVSFAPADAPDGWAQAVLNRPVTGGDRIWADSAGRAELHVGSTAIRVAALTSVDVLNLDDDTLQMRLAQGSINLRVRELAHGEVIEVATPAGAVLVRQPGSYRISVDPQSESTRVLVNFGQAEVVTPTQTLTVPSSQAAVMSARAGISFELAAYAAADDFDRWAAERDRREDRVASTRYVSRDMTGYEDLDHYGTWRTLPEYGAVWVPSRVAPGWAPYRYGHWAWVSPWGWTWVDDAPWGFAPFHYGRWVSTGGYWAWAPGAVARRPVYAPALVAFVGGSRWSASVSSGPAVAWFPLGYRERYTPWYRASETHVRNVNVTHVTNVTNIYNNSSNVTNVTYVNRNNPQAVTVVPQQAFISARPVAQASVQVAPAELAKAELVQASPPAEPVRASFVHNRPGNRPPAQTLATEVVAVSAPKSALQTSVTAQDGATASPRRAEEPRVRVIGREWAERRAAERAGPQAVQAAPAATTGAATAGAAAAGSGAASAGVAAKAAPPAPAAAPAASPAAAKPTAPASAAGAAPTITGSPAAATATPQPAAAVAPAPRKQGDTRAEDSAGRRLRTQEEVERRAARTDAARQAGEERRAVQRDDAAAAAVRAEAARVRHERSLEQRSAAHAEDRAARVERRAAPEARPPARVEEAPRPKPAPPAATPGQGATRAASPPHEVRFNERPHAPAAQAPQPRPAEPPRTAPPPPREHKRPQP